MNYNPRLSYITHVFFKWTQKIDFSVWRLTPEKSPTSPLILICEPRYFLGKWPWLFVFAREKSCWSKIVAPHYYKFRCWRQHLVATQTRLDFSSSSMADHFAEIKLAEQKSYNSIPFPWVLTPNSTTNLSFLTETIRTQKPFLESLLLKAGAVLLRGFDVKTANDFNDVVEAFGYEELPYAGGAAPRSHVVGRVFTANESSLDRNIPFHQEMALVMFLVSGFEQLQIWPKN